MGGRNSEMWQPDGWDVRTRIGVLTPHGDVGPESELQAMAPDGAGVPVVATCAAAVAGLRELNVERIALFNPPWFDAQLDRLGAEYFTSQGLDVVKHGPCGLPSSQRSINPSELFGWVLAHTPASA